MTYQTNREKIINWIEKGLIPKLVERDYDYNSIIAGICAETGSGKNIVEDVINSYVVMGKIARSNLIIATDKQLKEYNEKQEAFKKEANKIVENAIGLVNGD